MSKSKVNSDDELFCSSVIWPVWKDTDIVAMRLCEDILFLTFTSQSLHPKEGENLIVIILKRSKKALS